MLPKKWGQGQLFAFSALDGDSFFTDDLAGTLSGDKIGVIFETLTRRTLYSGDINKDLSPEITCVASDIIEVNSQKGNFSIIFAERHLIVGEYIPEAGVIHPESKKEMLEAIDEFMDEIENLMQETKAGADTREERDKIQQRLRKLTEHM